MRVSALGPLVRLAGGDPARVLALADALHREAGGQRAWQHAQEGGGWLGPEASRWLTLFVLFLISIPVSTLVKTLAVDRTLLAGMVLCLAQLGAVVLTTARDAVWLLLSGEDRQVIGWWPVGEREMVLARCCLLLRGMLQTTLAVAGLPLLVLAVHAPRTVWTGSGALIGLGLHTVTLGALLVLGIRGLARLLGLPWARRTVELLGLLVLIVLSGQAGADRLRGFFMGLGDLSSSWQALLLPVSWFAAWTALWPPSAPVLSAAVLGAAAGAAAVSCGLRCSAGRNRGESASAAGFGHAGIDWTRPLMAILGPSFSGREGRILLLLLRAHLRRDWRLTSQLLFLPPLYLAVIWRHASPPTGPEPVDLLVATRAPLSVVLFLGLLGLLLGTAFTYTGEPSASWILRSGVVDGRRMLTLHRRLLRVLVAVPFLTASWFLLQLRAAVPWPVLIPAAAVGLLACELSATAGQWLRPALPFSRAWRRNESGGSGTGIWFLAILAPLILIWGRLVLESSAWGWPATIVVQLLLLFWGRRLLWRRVGWRGLYGLSPRR